MIFQCGPNTGIAISSHSYGLISSTLLNSGFKSPLEWYFKTMAFQILNISMASWVQSCKIPATVADWNDISMWSWHCQFFKFLWPYDFKIPAHHNPVKWYSTGVQPPLALPILHIPMAFWVQSCQILATLAHWNNFQWGPNTGIANS